MRGTGGNVPAAIEKEQGSESGVRRRYEKKITLRGHPGG